MASVKNGILVANTPSTVTVDGGAGGVLVINCTQTGIIWARLGGGVASVRGDNCYAVLGQRVLPSQGSGVTVSLIADAGLTYSVEGLSA